MPDVKIEPKKTYVSLATFIGATFVIVSIVGYAVTIKTKLDYTAEQVKDIPQMKIDIARISQTLIERSSVSKQ